MRTALGWVNFPPPGHIPPANPRANPKPTFLSVVLGLVVAVASLVLPCQASLIDPSADVLYHPSSQGTAEAVLSAQIQATAVTVSAAHSGDIPAPTPNDYYADSHTKVFANLNAGANGIFTLQQFDPFRTLNHDGVTPLGELQGVLLYVTLHLKSGRYVLDNESNENVLSAIVQIGTSLNVWSTDPTIGVNCRISPSVSRSGSLAADTNGPDGFPDWAHMTQAKIDAASVGSDKLAAIIHSDDPVNYYTAQPIYTDIDDPVALAAFVGTGAVSFGYGSSPFISYCASNQYVAAWAIPPTFDIEARVVYLYRAFPGLATLYEASPEPATLSLLALGGLAVIRRRRKGAER